MDLNKEIRETIAFYCGGTYENRKLATEKILQICKDKPLPIHGVVVELPSKKSKEFERWTQSKGYEPAFNGLWYEKNNQTYNTDLLHRAFTNEIEFGN
jgi:hypothetical protein|tara:strand:+ start:488 stop:781 length:294 start_codon:yes stop_codon:yes gene_type:complete